MLTTLIVALKFFAFKVAPVLASCLITIAYTPQIWKSHTTKNVKGISLLFWILINAFLLCMWSNALGIWLTTKTSGAFGYFMTETINWAFAFWQLILVIVYGKEDRKAKRLAKKLADKNKK